jgi:hypothetical protein
MFPHWGRNLGFVLLVDERVDVTAYLAEPLTAPGILTGTSLHCDCPSDAVGYTFRHGSSRLTASKMVGSL